MTLKEKLRNIQTEIHVHKGQKNNFGGYMYRSAEDILEALKPFETKYDVVFHITENLEQIGDHTAVISRAIISEIAEEDKAIVSIGTAIIDFDAKGMQNPQRTGSASSYAKKYALGNLLLLDDTKDSDASNTHGNNQTMKKDLLTKTHSRYKGVLKAVSEGKSTIEKVKQVFDLGEGVEETLNKAKLLDKLV
jgi:hypothetical protein